MRILIVTPARPEANNGNWQTAKRWARMLGGQHTVQVEQQWRGPEDGHFDAMIALHARRSADSIAAWSLSKQELSVGNLSGKKAVSSLKFCPGLAVVLTGTDLYRDIDTDPAAQASLQLAQRLVVLQELGAQRLPASWRAKAQVIFQSAPRRSALAKTKRHLRALMVGHLRDEKLPQTLFAAARLLQPDEGILIDHIGAPLDAALGEQAAQTARACPHYRHLGARDHAATRSAIQRAHVLVHTSRLEGGAHVVLEAVQSGTPILASRMDGNVGMLGADYLGYFAVEDAHGLVALLRKLRAEQRAGSGATLMSTLTSQCQGRAELFEPAREQAALLQLVNNLASSRAPSRP